MSLRALISGALWCALFWAHGAEFFVSPNAGGNGDGSRFAPWSAQEALNHPSSVSPGDTLWLRGGTYRGAFTSRLTGRPDRSIIVRQYSGEHAQIDGSLTIDGSASAFWGFEVMNSDRSRPNQQWSRPAGITINGARTTLINLVIHDAGQGIGCWSATDSEIYGCLIYNNGNSQYDHGIYAQNQTGTIRITDNIIFNNFSYGLHVFGSERISVAGFDIEGNTVFNNGSLSTDGDAQNILVGGVIPAHRIRLAHNRTYGGFKTGSVTLGLVETDAPNIDAEIEDNYFADFVAFRNWNRSTVIGNTVIAPGTVLEFVDTIGRPTQFLWDHNHFFSEERGRPFAAVSAIESKGLSFDQWQAVSAYDLHSTYAKGRPRNVQVFVTPNRYEPGRGSVTVFNWSGQASAPADLSALVPMGAWYEVRNAQNFFGPPVLIKRYFGGFVQLPLTDPRVAAPMGLPTPVSTAPGFNVFVVLPLSEFPKSDFLRR